MSKYKLLIVIPNLGKGGAQQVYREQLRFYEQHGEVVGCVFNWDGSFADDHHPLIVSLDVPAGNNPVSKLYFFLQRIRRLRRLKKRHAISISISHLEGADYVNILSRRTEKIFCWIHGTKKFDGAISGFTGWIRKKILMPFLYRRSDMLIAVSHGIQTELIETFALPASSVRTIINGVDVSGIQVAIRSAGSSLLPAKVENQRILITHCRFAKQKNLTALLEIFAELKKRRSVKLVILGDGELRDELIITCNTLHCTAYNHWGKNDPDLDYDIYFLGYQENPYPYLAKASLYLLTSSWEGFPLALCEALACHLPVMAADCYTGPREILAPGLQADVPVSNPNFGDPGILMPLVGSKESVRLWADTIDNVLEDDKLLARLADGAGRRAQDFDKEAIEKVWLEIIAK